MEDRKCNKCDIVLTDDNWYASRRLKKHYVCKPCYNASINKTQYHAASIKRKYGLDASTYTEMLEEQSHACTICGKAEENKRSSRLAVDHCHETGAVRGLLCSECNTGLGKFKDDISLLDKAKEYLIASRAYRFNGV